MLFSVAGDAHSACSVAEKYRVSECSQMVSSRHRSHACYCSPLLWPITLLLRYYRVREPPFLNTRSVHSSEKPRPTTVCNSALYDNTGSQQPTKLLVLAGSLPVVPCNLGLSCEHLRPDFSILTGESTRMRFDQYFNMKKRGVVNAVMPLMDD